MKETTKLLIAVGAGVAVGGLLGVLFAPKSGYETRKRITDAGKDVADKVKSVISKGKEQLSGMKESLDHVNESVEEYI
jgi:gas vesicle protein